MYRFLLLSFLLINISLNAQWFNRLTLETDAYGIENIDRSKITQIYVDETGLSENLALLPYIQKIRLRLYDLGFSISRTASSANFILKFDVFTSDPIIRARESSYRLRGEEKTIERKNSEGKTETITITGEHRSIPIIEEDTFYKKIMRMKLYQKKSDRLIWQGESIIDNEVNSHGNYAHLLVYESLRYFLKTTAAHPIKNSYSKRHRRIIAEMFSVPKY